MAIPGLAAPGRSASLKLVPLATAPIAGGPLNAMPSTQPDPMPTLQELLDRKASLEGEIAQARRESRAKALGVVLATMAEAGLTVQDVEAAWRQSEKRGREAVRRPVAPKYRDSETGATWTGRGLKPTWLVARLAAGKSLSDFAI